MLDKSAWRELLSARRRALPVDVADTEAHALAQRLAVLDVGKLVCAYLPLRREPGDVRMLEALTARGVRVLLPHVSGDEPLDWAPFTGEKELVTGRFGIREPSGDRLGVEAIRDADTVLLPALAVDRRGVRLGKGGGFYDRSLPFARGRLMAVVRDAEVVDELPAEEHDIRVHAVLCPDSGVREL